MPQLSLHTPLGEVTISEDGGVIVALDWGRGRDQEATPLLREACDQLQKYFDGKRMSFDLPLAPEGSDFQKARLGRALRNPTGRNPQLC
jgi:methylated-DNA-[protein]-cysteine S-methyltransferase